ncbi:uncharacterized protein Bfra_009080ca [Botrytis fragariae]|uniref:Uncharacterized protein n=1 Tax=Botrytis fragariae TaxID=1964551 RepID=A0A8H6AR23_9HELO|nr:uncharacterized protein Bfra_009080ca [Botrytis fragariae]KAF5872052.1 hypothetical protein Bfra_009080ca [Botrytis fragariae]
MDPEIPAPKDSQDVQGGGSVQQAVELVGKMLEQIQIELEKMLSPGGEIPPEADALENEKDESQKRYKNLESNYQKISEELKAFGRQMASAPVKSGQVQAELKFAQAQKDVEKLKAEVEYLQAQCNNYQAQAHQHPQNVQKLETQIEELKNKNIELQRRNVERRDQDPDVWRRWVYRYQAAEEPGPMHLWGPEYLKMIDSVRSLVIANLDMEQEPKMELISQQKPRDRMLRRAFDMKPDSFERTHRLGRAIFQFLSDEILFQPLFGLDDENEGVKMEAGLVAFEKKIRDASAGDEHIVSNVKLVLANEFAGDTYKNLDCHNWKKMTYRCAKKFRKRDSETRIGAFASALEDFLKPLPKKEHGGGIEERLLKICRMAFALSQTLRAEPLEEFKVSFSEPGIPIVFHKKHEDNTMEIWGQEGGYPADEAGTVAYTYFGGLFFKDIHKQEWSPLVSAKVISKGEDISW